jgi:hypothetical protein
MPTLTVEQNRALRAALDPFLVMQYDNARYECLMPDDVVYQGQWIPPDDVELHHWAWWQHYGETLTELHNADLVEAETVEYGTA